MSQRKDEQAREMCTRGKDGKLQDAALWEEILGPDTQGTWQVGAEPPPIEPHTGDDEPQ